MPLNNPSEGGVSTVSVVTASGISGSVANPTTTPAITLSVATQSAGDNSTNAATTAFVTTAVNNAISGVNPAVAVQAATTANVTGYMYTNGASGVGATLTQVAGAVVVIDGYTVLLGDRVLFKNQSTAANNGIYTVTTLGSALVQAVFTRALDYDQPSDMNNTGAIPVVNGTVNAATSWVLTSSVTTIGTDALTFTQFTLNPTTLMTTTTYDAAAIAQQVLGTTATQTVTNKRITKRSVVTNAPGATPSINSDTTDFADFTGLATAITSMTMNLTGTPTQGQTLWIAFTDNGTPAGITWGTSFEASTVALPTTTVASARLDVAFIWNSVTSKWRCVGAS